MIREAIIIASEKTTNWLGDTEKYPVSMLKINDMTLLEYQLNFLDFWGISHAVIAVDSEIIKQQIGAGYKSVDIEYSDGANKLGTGGAIKKAFEKIISHSILVLDGNSFFDVNLKRLEDFRRKKEAVICVAMRFIEENSTRASIMVDDEMRIVGFVDDKDPYSDNFMNTGVYCIQSSYFMNKKMPEVFSFEEEFLVGHYKSDAFYGHQCYSVYLDLSANPDKKKVEHVFNGLPYR